MRRPTAGSYNNILLMHHSVQDSRGACGSLEAMLVACSTPLAEIQEQRSTEHVHAISKRPYGYYGGETSDHDTGDDTDMVDEYTCLYLPKMKKRRLTPEQVKMLEQSFAVESKMEPDQKVQLARELNLQPRQVAVWFQNRRARWKTKQLEKDYDALKLTYESLKADFNGLLQEKEHLKEEVAKLTDRLQGSLARDVINSKTKKSTQYQLLSVVTHETRCDCISKEVVDNDECSDEKFPQEASTSKESAVSEGNSPDAVEGQIALPFTEGLVGSHEFFKPARIYSMEANNSQPHGLKSEIDEEDAITYSSRFFLEADEGAFSWWSSSWPSA